MSYEQPYSSNNDKNVNDRLTSILAYLDKFDATIVDQSKNKENASTVAVNTIQNESSVENNRKVLGVRNVSSPVSFKGNNKLCRSKEGKQWIWDMHDIELNPLEILSVEETNDACNNSVVNKSNDVRHKFEDMQTQLTALNSKYNELQEELHAIKQNNSSEIAKAHKKWKRRVKTQEAEIKSAKDRHVAFMKKLEDDALCIRLKVERVQIDIEKLCNAKSKVCTLEEDRGKEEMQSVKKSLHDLDAERLKKLENSKTTELKHAIAASLEPEILKVVSDNKAEQERLIDKYKKDLDEFKYEITQQNELQFVHQSQNIESSSRKEIEQLRNHQQSLVIELTKQYDNDFKSIQTNYIQHLNDDKQKFEESRQDIIRGNADQIKKLKDHASERMKNACDQHEFNLKRINEVQKHAINEEYRTASETEIEWKESRELELRTASGNIFSNEIDDIKRKLKGDIDKVKKKLKSELEQSKANYSEKYASKLKEHNQKYIYELDQLKEQEHTTKEDHHRLSLKVESLTQLLSSTNMRITDSHAQLRGLKQSLIEKEGLLKTTNERIDVAFAQKNETYLQRIESMNIEMKSLTTRKHDLNEKLCILPELYTREQNCLKAKQDSEIDQINERIRLVLHKRDCSKNDALKRLETLRKEVKIKSDKLDVLRRKKYCM